MSFTKSVISFAGNSALIGLCLPGLALASQTEGRSPTKKPTKVHIAGKKSPHLSPRKTVRPLTPQLLRQERPEKSPGVTEINAAQREVSKDLQTLPLGRFTVRAYTHYDTAAKTASGVWPQSGRTVAVDPDIIPFGTRIYIEGVGERIAEDSGTRIKGRKLDVFLPSVTHCVRFGVQNRDVQLVLD